MNITIEIKVLLVHAAIIEELAQQVAQRGLAGAGGSANTHYQYQPTNLSVP
jgi:hypothetical protein